MGASKDIFLKKKDLSAQWQAVAKADYFAEVLAYARGELLDRTEINTDNLKGARLFQNILLTLADEELPIETDLPPSGLIHNLDPLPRKPKDKEPPKQ